METVGVQSGPRRRRNPISAIPAGNVQLAQVFVQLRTVIVLQLVATRFTASVQLLQLVLLVLLAQRKASSLRCVDLNVTRIFVPNERNALRGHIVNRRRQRHIPIVSERIVVAVASFGSWGRITTAPVVDHL